MVGREVFCPNQQIEGPAYLCKIVTFDIFMYFRHIFLHSLETNLRVLHIFGDGGLIQFRFHDLSHALYKKSTEVQSVLLR